MAIIAAEHVATIIAENILPTAALYDRDARAEAERINAAEGWTFTTSGALGNTVRHSGVQLSAAELERAYALALEMAE